MSVYDDMKAILATVPGHLGQVWQYRKRTTQRDVSPPVFGAWIDVATLALDKRDNAEEVDNGEDITESITARVPGVSAVAIGDQMKDPDTSDVYHVREQVGSGIGTNRFTLERKHRDQFGSIRGGGIA